MNSGTSRIPYRTLVAIVDDLLDTCEEDVGCLAAHMDRLEPGILAELLTSDLLNAYQVFYFFFRTDPGDLARERMDLEPASVLRHGLMIDECELLELIFAVRENTPVIIASDGEQTVAMFTGTNAYADGLEYIRNPEYNS